MTRCLFISRSSRWSPGPLNPGRDAAILQAVRHHLDATGCHTELIGEDQLLANAPSAIAPAPSVMAPAQSVMAASEALSYLRSFDYIYSMARSLPVLMLLERSGVPCANAPRGVMHTSQSREDTLTLLLSAGLPVPPFWAYEAAEDEMFLCEPHLQQLLPAWIKAMHPQGVQPGDVTLANTPLEADTQLMRFQSSGYTDIIAMHHVEGPLTKCYAVIPSEVQDQCQRLAQGNDQCQRQGHDQCQRQGHDQCQCQGHDQCQRPSYYINNEQYAPLAFAIASSLHLQVFGFDLITDADGRSWIIDVNDWPSFSSVLDDAAPAIAGLRKEKGKGKSEK